jgi:heparosan-N-sulfate-glucuronate 5-epimerase
MRTLVKTRQLAGTFVPGDPHSGYYNDLRVHVAAHAQGPGPAEGMLAFERLTRNRTAVHPVVVVQIGIGAWMLIDTDPGWREVVARTADWIVDEMDADGLIPFLYAFPHTYRLDPPWYSALSQGEAASFLIRAARTLGEPGLEVAAAKAGRSLVESSGGLVAMTPEGPVLQEYPTDPPAHVLNGWIFALWGLYDLSVSIDDREPFETAFRQGIAALSARLPLYGIGRNWSRYDLFPHPVANTASPFYHRLHIELLAAMNALVHRDAFVQWGVKWQAGEEDRIARSEAIARKILFRAARPRSALLNSILGSPSRRAR